MVPSALALILADPMPWQPVFWITAAFMLPGFVCTLLTPEPTVYGAPPKNMREAIILPFREFVARDGWRKATVHPRLHLAVQDRRQHGHRAGDQVLSRYRLFHHADRPGRQRHRAAGPAWPAAWSAACGWSSWASTARLWVFGVLQAVAILGFAWLARRARTVAAERRDRLRSVRQPGAGRRRAGRVHVAQRPTRATPPPSTRCFPAWPRCRAPSSIPRSASSSPNWAGSCSLSCASSWRFPAMMMLPKIAPWKSANGTNIP